MKSKRLLTELFNEANKLSCEETKYTTHDLWEMCKQIERDLEILEILRKHIYSSDESVSIILDDLRCCEDFEKVKGWLYEK